MRDNRVTGGYGERGGQVGVSDADDLIYELQDQVQRVDRKVSALLVLAGLDPEQAGRLPGEEPQRPVTEVGLPAGSGVS